MTSTTRSTPTKRLAAEQRTSANVSIMLLLAEPDDQQLCAYDRTRRYQALLANSEARRKALLEWIDARGLSSHLAHLSEPTAFSLLFARCTPELAAALRQAPGVHDIASGDLTLKQPDFRATSSSSFYPGHSEKRRLHQTSRCS